MVGHLWDEQAEPKHVDIIMETLGLRRAEGTKTLSLPSIKRSIDEANSGFKWR